MKKTIFAITIAMLGFASCDQAPAPSDQAILRTKENTTVFEDEAVTDANRSVQAFGEAMEAFDRGDKEAVARHLQTGVDALVNEGKSLNGEVKTRLERAIKRLERLQADFREGKIATADDLLNAISEAEKDVPHKLISGYTEEEVEPENE
ncbi:MAG: hypothetical protein KDD06_09260 [Phaeodactylibacter sp.]|nr:hypothetical protein [Phaeodactylibacter sp.]MCB9264233.1 hypothetical protein [Lewinellaceae bacterium]MCB9291249.1 hypothetical protein [Lewinellaceae bacterium]